jgi:myo-inositol-1(or 4)-monophosphatase
MSANKRFTLNNALEVAVAAARAAGQIMKENINKRKRISAVTSHDVKLALDVQCQKTIQKILTDSFPYIPILGEEGTVGNTSSEMRWVVDPIDGTVNYSFGIPHACTCIALQIKDETKKDNSMYPYITQIGVIYDPFMDELWTAIKGKKSKLNGKTIAVGKHTELKHALVAIGLGKTSEEVSANLPYFCKVSQLALKTRIMGSAGLGLAYVACGRFDAYVERGINIWDIAAGGLILECAGGVFWTETTPKSNFFRMIATNQALLKQLPPFE